MKTRDRILNVSLELFNREGEASQTAVDIANAVELSPGNLYYHFKGKDAIIRALFDQFEEEMQIILRGSRGAVSSIEDNWVYIYIVLEEIYDFRFFYRNIAELLARYSDLALRFRALLKEKEIAMEGVLTGLEATGDLRLEAHLRHVICEQIIATLTLWLTQDAIQGSSTDPSDLIHKTVYQIMCLVVPHMHAQRPELMERMAAYYEEKVTA